MTMNVQELEDRIDELTEQLRHANDVIGIRGREIRRLRHEGHEYQAIAELVNDELKRQLARRRPWTRRADLLGWGVTAVSVAGVLCNNARVIWCFPLWLLSNGVTCGLHLRQRMWSLAVRDGMFFVLSAAGWWLWSKGV
ncbi:MAG: nicotinamide mononucleotide transporter [Planctomycetota bacterium]